MREVSAFSTGFGVEHFDRSGKIRSFATRVRRRPQRGVRRAVYGANTAFTWVSLSVAPLPFLP